MDFAQRLVRRRRALGYSQLDLAMLAGVSQRHISFLETGRAKPGRQALDKLIPAMATDPADQTALYAAAGFAPPQEARHRGTPDSLGSAERDALQRMLGAFGPTPAVATTPDGTIVGANRGFEKALRRALGPGHGWHSAAGGLTGNLFDLSLRPDGLARLLANPEEVIPPLRQRMAGAADRHGADGTLHDRLDGLASALPSRTAGSPPPRPPRFPVERYRLGGTVLSLVATPMRWGHGGDPSGPAITIEAFLPTDAATERWLDAASRS